MLNADVSLHLKNRLLHNHRLHNLNTKRFRLFHARLSNFFYRLAILSTDRQPVLLPTKKDKARDEEPRLKIDQVKSLRCSCKTPTTKSTRKWPARKHIRLLLDQHCCKESVSVVSQYEAIFKTNLGSMERRTCFKSSFQARQCLHLVRRISVGSSTCRL